MSGVFHSQLALGFGRDRRGRQQGPDEQSLHKIMANKHMKRCSMLLEPKEMQIKATVRYHIWPIKLAGIKNDNS